MPAKSLSKNIIYIYAGAGTSKTCLAQTKNALSPFLKTSHRIKYISARCLVEDRWEPETALLIIPGGADIPYTQDLNGVGNLKIRDYVENGGSFLGICAGGYYAGAFVDFAKETPIEVWGPRELSFFPGTVKGPVLAPYHFGEESGVRAAQICWYDPADNSQASTFSIYYHGGGYFVDAHQKASVDILAYYGRQREFAAHECAAVVECRIGKGKAILSGVHFEYDPLFLDLTNPFLKSLIPHLIKGNVQRHKFIFSLLKRLGLK